MNEWPLLELAIHHFHIDHNAPCVTPQNLHDYCLWFLPGITVVKANRRQLLGIFFGGGGGVSKLLYDLRENGE